jgi:single-strand DNA-binding protein
MVGSVNKVILLGNLGRDPEIRSMQSGSKMASFSIATSKRWKDRSTQEQKEKTSWHNIVVFGDGLVDIVERFVKKGSKIYVEGELQTRKWQDQDGKDRYTTEVVLQGYNGNLTLLDSRNQSNSIENQSQNSPEESKPENSFETDSSDSSDSSDLDEDIPF